MRTLPQRMIISEMPLLIVLIFLAQTAGNDGLREYVLNFVLGQGHHELCGKSYENKSFQPKPISAFYLYYDRTLLLFSRPMRDKDTSAFREMFQYSPWLWPSSRPNQILLILTYYCTWQFLVSLWQTVRFRSDTKCLVRPSARVICFREEGKEELVGDLDPCPLSDGSQGRLLSCLHLSLCTNHPAPPSTRSSSAHASLALTLFKL